MRTFGAILVVIGFLVILGTAGTSDVEDATEMLMAQRTPLYQTAALGVLGAVMMLGGGALLARTEKRSSDEQRLPIIHPRGDAQPQ